MQASEATASTIRSAAWPAARIACADRLDVVDDARRRVDLHHQDRLDLMRLSVLSRASTSSGRTARRKSPGRISTSTPSMRAHSPQPSAKRPLSSTSTLSPRESTLVRPPPRRHGRWRRRCRSGPVRKIFDRSASSLSVSATSGPGIDVDRRPLHGGEHLDPGRRSARGSTGIHGRRGRAWGLGSGWEGLVVVGRISGRVAGA